MHLGQERRISEPTSEISERDARIAALEGDIDFLNSEIRDLNEEIPGLREKISRLTLRKIIDHDTISRLLAIIGRLLEAVPDDHPEKSRDLFFLDGALKINEGIEAGDPDLRKG